ncbi:MAG TPA: hypothetical protein VK076_03585 [Candidatus Sphingobacterium stercoripullorum]|nr:hypothetical protein [Candidatus Sphingobacterium stercoripullorum]
MKKCALAILFFLSSNLSFAQYLKQNEALEDMKEFKVLMETESSYYQMSDSDFKSRYQQIEKQILQQDSIPTYFLAYELEKIISETIDRHASLRIDNFDDEEFEILGLYFLLYYPH